MKKFISISYVLSLVLLVFFGIFLLWFFSGPWLTHQIVNEDRLAFIWINQHHTSFFDGVMYDASDKFFWLPFYVIVIAMIIKEYKSGSWKVLLTVFILEIASDQLTSSLIKNLVRRLRPSHERGLQLSIHLSKAGPGGLYGFVSSHASNAFALAVFLGMLLPRSYRSLKVILFCWAALVSYSRVYNGVHYPGDVLAAILIGAGLGYLFYFLYQKYFTH